MSLLDNHSNPDGDRSLNPGTACPEGGESVSRPPRLPPATGDAPAQAGLYQALLDSGQVESRAALARHLGVSRARVTQVLRRLPPGQRPAKSKTVQSPHDEGEAGDVGHE